MYQRGAHIIWEVDGAKEKVRLISVNNFGTAKVTLFPVVLSKPLSFWQIVHRHQDVVFRLRKLQVYKRVDNRAYRSDELNHSHVLFGHRCRFSTGSCSRFLLKSE